MHILGIDIGGTKLAVGLVESVTGRVLAVRMCTTPPDAAQSYACVLELARSLIAEAAEPPVAAGVCFGGPVAADGRTVRRSMHIPGWELAPLAQWIERDLGLRCTVANDGNAIALAEWRYGAGRGVNDLMYLTVSTGIGGGLLLNGSIYHGAHAWAGELGHQLLDPNGPRCTCGKRGCLEALASGWAIAHQARARVASNPTSRLALVAPAAITAQLVAEAAAQHDPLALELWTTALGWLGIGIANATTILNPARIILGGGLTRAGELLFQPLRRMVAEYTLDPAVRVVPATLGSEGGVVGAAVLCEKAPSC